MKNKKFLSFIFITLFCFLFFFLNKGTVQAAVISAFKGKVEVLKKGEKNWVAVKVNASLNEGDKIRTFNKSSCVIKLSNYETIKLAAFTTFAISELKQSSSQKNTKLKVWGGKIYAKVKKTLKPGSSFEVKSPTAIAGVRSTEFSVNVLGEERTDISCTNGIVSVENTPYTPGVVVKKIELMPFQKTTVLKNNPPEEPKAMTEEEKKNESEEQKNIESAKLIEETTANLYLVLDNGDEEIETEEEEIKVSGIISDTNAELKIENEKVEIDKEGKFEKTIKLKEGENQIKVFAKNKNGASTSKTIKVNKGKAEGFLKIEFPKDGYKTNDEEIETIGKIHPKGTLTINGEEVETSKTGEFKKKIELVMGENTLIYIVKAVNKEVSKTIKVIRGTSENEVAEDIVLAIFNGVIRTALVQGIITKEEYKILKLKGKLGTIIFVPQGIDEEFPKMFATLDSTINYLKDAQISKQAEGFILTIKNGEKYEVKINVCK